MNQHEDEIEQEGDVDVVEVEMLEAEAAAQFSKPFFCHHEDGRTVEFDTEDEACAYQREHRAKNGMDPMTGEQLEMPEQDRWTMNPLSGKPSGR